MSVISLGLFEHVTNFETWSRHVKGLTELVVSRGKGQFSSTAGIAMFSQVRADMAAVCIHSLQPFPRTILDLQKEATNHFNTSSGFWLVGVLATRCVNLLSTLWATTITDVPTLECFLEEGTVLQDDFQSVVDLLIQEEPYVTTQELNGDQDYIFNARFDLYKSSWAIRLWNNYRMLRMVVCEVMFYLLNRAFKTEPLPACREQLEMKMEETSRLLANLGDDILASVPQTLGLVSSTHESHTFISPPSDARISGGHMLAWPLYTVGKSPVTTSKTRQWVMTRLRDIGQNSGMSMALQFVKDIDEIDESARQLTSANFQ